MYLTLWNFFIIVLSLVLLIDTLVKLKRGKSTYGETFIWAFIWLCLMAIAVFPAFLNYLSRYSGIERGIDNIVYLSIIFLFYALFKTHAKLDSIEREITEVVRSIAISNAESSSGKSASSDGSAGSNERSKTSSSKGRLKKVNIVK